MFPNLLRAILLAALFGVAVLLLGGIIANLGRKASTAVRSVA